MLKIITNKMAAEMEGEETADINRLSNFLPEPGRITEVNAESGSSYGPIDNIQGRLQASSLEFTVEKVIDVVTSQNGLRYYQVKWYDTWLDEATLSEKCQHLIQAYWNSIHDVGSKETENVDSSSEPRKASGLLNESSQIDDVNNLNESNIVSQIVKTGRQIQPVIVANKMQEKTDPDHNSSQDDKASLISLQNRQVAESNLLLIPNKNSTKDQENIDTTVSSEIVIDESSHLVDYPNNMCNICGKQLSSKKTLKRHMTLLHLKNGRHPCTLCNRRFFCKTELLRHMPVHTNEKKFPCSICGKHFKQAGQAYKHMQTHNGEKKYQCNICGSKFLHKNNLISHFSTHSQERLFGCGECQAKFKHKQSVYTHYKNCHSQEREFICQVCDAAFQHKQDLTQHVKVVHRDGVYQCTVCPRKFMKHKSLLSHIERHEKGSIVPAIMEISEVCDEKTVRKPQFVTCPECRCIFQSVTRMNAHLESHKSGPCTSCSKQTENENIIAEVSEKENNDADVEMDLSESNDLEDPMQVDEKEPISCNLCGKTFKWAYSLARHHQTFHADVTATSHPKASDLDSISSFPQSIETEITDTSLETETTNTSVEAETANTSVICTPSTASSLNEIRANTPSDIDFHGGFQQTLSNAQTSTSQYTDTLNTKSSSSVTAVMHEQPFEKKSVPLPLNISEESQDVYEQKPESSPIEKTISESSLNMSKFSPSSSPRSPTTPPWKKKNFRDELFSQREFPCDTCKTHYPSQIELLKHLISTHKSELVVLKKNMNQQ